MQALAIVALVRGVSQGPGDVKAACGNAGTLSAGPWIGGTRSFAGLIVAFILSWPYLRRWEQQRRKQLARQAYRQMRARRKGK